jgi:MFS family permease
MKKQYHPSVAVVASCVAIFLPGALVFGFPGVMGTHWQEIFGVGRADVGQTLFFVLAAVGIFMFVAGRLQEKIDPAWVMALGALIYGPSTAAVGHAVSIHWVYLWAFLTGASSAFIYLPALTVVQRWYPQRRGLVSGLVSGFLSDVVGRKMVMITTFLLAGGAYYLLPHVTGIIIWSVLAAVIGFAFGTLFAVSAPLVSDCFGMEHFGSIFGGIFTAFGFFSGALGPWLGGYLLDLT